MDNRKYLNIRDADPKSRFEEAEPSHDNTYTQGNNKKKNVPLVTKNNRVK